MLFLNKRIQVNDNQILSEWNIYYQFSAAKAALGMQMSVSQSVCQSVSLSVSHAYLFKAKINPKDIIQVT